MTTRTSTLLALPLLLGLTTGAAQATLLEIELTGTLDYGNDYTNEFGWGTNVDLADKTATFRWLIDTDLLGTNYGDGTTYSFYNDCTDSVCGNNPFVTASVTLNGITRTIQNNLSSSQSYIYLWEDQDGPGVSLYDYLSIYGSDYYNYSSQSYYKSNYISLYAYDYVDSIINGVGVNQLDGWSTNLINNSGYDDGYAYFDLENYSYDPQLPEYYTDYHHAYGNIYLSSANLRWGDGYDNSPSVPEPASLALLGIGLIGMSVVRRRRRG